MRVVLRVVMLMSAYYLFNNKSSDRLCPCITSYSDKLIKRMKNIKDIV